jgi:hypothetical protein
VDSNKVYLDCDLTAAEPTVITELTRDPGMMMVYGPEARNQDVYLYFGANIPGLGDEIRAAGYDPLNPTKEGLANAKKKCKSIRNICKTVVLAKQYRAGVKKINQTLRLNGVNLTYSEVENICQVYDETFKGVKEFSYLLEREWEERNGWVYNGLGRPMTVAESYKKDLVNRVIQSTGHDIHMKLIRIFRRLMQTSKIPFKWVIADFHDQFIIECSVLHAEKIKDLLIPKAFDILNEELQGLIPIKGDPKIVPSMAEAKLE